MSTKKSPAKPGARHVQQLETISLKQPAEIAPKTSPEAKSVKPLSLEKQMAKAAGLDGDEIDLSLEDNKTLITGEVDMPPPPESTTRKRLVGELKQVLEDNAAAILAGSKKSQPQLAQLQDYVKIDRSNTAIKTKGSVPETGPAKKHVINADRLLKALGTEIGQTRSLAELRTAVLAELTKLNAQDLQNMPNEATTIFEKIGLLSAVNTLLTPKEQEKANVNQLLQAEVERGNAERNQELARIQQEAAKEYQEKKEAVFSAIEKEFATLLAEMTDSQKVLRHGATSVHTQIAQEKSLLSKIFSRFTSSRGSTAPEKLINHAQAGDTYQRPFSSTADFLNAVGLSERERQRATDFNDLNQILQNTYELNQRKLESTNAEDAASITTLEELRTSFASAEVKQLIAAQEGISRALALINGRGVAQFERRSPAKNRTGLYSRTRPFTKLQNEVTQALTALHQLAA